MATYSNGGCSIIIRRVFPCVLTTPAFDAQALAPLGNRGTDYSKKFSRTDACLSTKRQCRVIGEVPACPWVSLGGNFPCPPISQVSCPPISPEGCGFANASAEKFLETPPLGGVQTDKTILTSLSVRAEVALPLSSQTHCSMRLGRCYRTAGDSEVERVAPVAVVDLGRVEVHLG
jgi:hypothetical protein